MKASVEKQMTIELDNTMEINAMLMIANMAEDQLEDTIKGQRDSKPTKGYVEGQIFVTHFAQVNLKVLQETIKTLQRRCSQ